MTTKFTTLSNQLVVDALAMITNTNMLSVTDDVFCIIENTEVLKKRYDQLVTYGYGGEMKFVNAGMAKIVKNLTGGENLRRENNPKSSLIDSYMQFL